MWCPWRFFLASPLQRSMVRCPWILSEPLSSKRSMTRYSWICLSLSPPGDRWCGVFWVVFCGRFRCLLLSMRARASTGDRVMGMVLPQIPRRYVTLPHGHVWSATIAASTTKCLPYVRVDHFLVPMQCSGISGSFPRRDGVRQHRVN